MLLGTGFGPKPNRDLVTIVDASNLLEEEA